MADNKGETRRERNKRFGKDHLTPEIIIPEHGLYIWNWYFDISSSMTRIIDGQAIRIPPSEFLAWRNLTGHIVQPVEYAILRDMDAAFCSAANSELSDAQARAAAEAEEKRKASKPRGRRTRG